VVHAGVQKSTYYTILYIRGPVTDYSDGQKLTKMLLTISLTNFLVTEVVKLNKSSLVKTGV